MNKQKILCLLGIFIISLSINNISAQGATSDLSPNLDLLPGELPTPSAPHAPTDNTDLTPNLDLLPGELPTPSTPHDPAHDDNSNWKKSKQHYGKYMKERELGPALSGTDSVQAFRQFTGYKNKIIEKLQSQSVQAKQITPQRFESFLMVDRAWPVEDDPKIFFQNTTFTRNIHAIPAIGNVTKPAWSGSYWPMRNGGLSVRYGKNDKNTIGEVDPESGEYTYFFNWSQSIYRYAQPEEHKMLSATPEFSKYVDDNYSPAEKYDLLVGDTDYTMTNFSKNEGLEYQYEGDVIGWFGICHGWAPASAYYPKPTRSVTLTATNGMQIRFLPDDIKGLASLFWANAEYKTLFVGTRCEYYFPDPGWFTSPGCLSINPASWLTIIGNQVGLWGENLTFDPAADPEIWNQPIKSYAFRYYNPITNEFFTDSNAAKVSMSLLKTSADEWLQYLISVAEPTTVSAIGVFMKITYTKLTDTDKLMHSDSTAEDEEHTEEYDSVIELDASDNMVGGEWKFKSHPNFIWYFDPSEPIMGIHDKDVTSFGGIADNSLSTFAKTSSAKGQPLKAIVEYLVYNSS